MISSLSIKVTLFSPYYTPSHTVSVPISSLTEAVSTIPECTVGGGMFSMINALFDFESKGRVRWIERPLRYTFTYTVTTFLNQYFNNSLVSLHKRPSLCNKLTIVTLSSIPSTVIPIYNEPTSTILWSTVAQVGSSLLITLLNHYIN